MMEAIIIISIQSLTKVDAKFYISQFSRYCSNCCPLSPHFFFIISLMNYLVLFMHPSFLIFYHQMFYLCLFNIPIYLVYVFKIGFFPPQKFFYLLLFLFSRTPKYHSFISFSSNHQLPTRSLRSIIFFQVINKDLFMGHLLCSNYYSWHWLKKIFMKLSDGNRQSTRQYQIIN